MKAGDKVQIIDFHIDRLVNRTGRVVSVGIGPYVKVHVPGYTNQLGNEDWYFTEDEVKKLEEYRN